MTRKPKVDGMQLPSGFPLVLAKDDGDMKAIKEAGLPLAYVLGALPGKHKDDPAIPRVFRCSKSLLAYAVTEVDNDHLDLLEIEEHCWFLLPPIPRHIVNDLDALFRMVDDKLGTEAIALLTYDPAKLGTPEQSEGWGVMVPKQKNTSGSCHYDPASVAEDKAEGVQIVGSVHSHPGMSAFASHTDVKDQADFDGIHITYGWKGKSKVTEYHVELQVQGSRFNYTPDQAFEGLPEPEVGDRVTAWAERVTKEEPKNYGYWQGNQTGYQGTGGTTGSKYGLPTSFRLPSEISDLNPRDVGIIVEMIPGESTCPACRFRLTEYDKDRRKCSDCNVFLSMPKETVEQVIEARWDKQKLSTPELDERAKRGVWFWKRWKEETEHKNGVMVYKERIDVVREEQRSPKA